MKTGLSLTLKLPEVSEHEGKDMLTGYGEVSDGVHKRHSTPWQHQ